MQSIFLDACAIIYWVEARNPWYQHLQFCLNSLKKEYGDLHLAVSDLSRLECLVKPLRNQQTETVSLYEQFFQHPQLHIQSLTPSVIEEALKLRVEYSIKTPDALQAASALIWRNDCIFLTADNGFKKIAYLNTQNINENK